MLVTIIGWVLFGLVVGLIARAIMPGKQGMGLIATTLLGVVGSFIGGFIGNLVTGRDALAMNPAGFIGAVLGALLVLFLVGMVGRRTYHRTA
ncbi:GlsB/YeaQ/YmgE family stress response membrane protein [Sandaracinus amylolyticus]|nr:GlsB/YeaQ/YmgE family stress response membrane protein [Sandaracinus amylolyticus]UJR86651.1 Hypothetical protein I5071_87520 [Sandaracinus amylolyticus]